MSYQIPPDVMSAIRNAVREEMKDPGKARGPRRGNSRYYQILSQNAAPMTVQEIRYACEYLKLPVPPDTTVRASLKWLVDTGQIEKHRIDGVLQYGVPSAFAGMRLAATP